MPWWANGNANGRGLLLGLARDVLPDSNGRVDATALLEQRADGATGALGSDEDDVDVWRGHDLRVLLVYDGEAVREVECLALGDERCQRGSCRGLAASESRFMMIVPRLIASSIGKSVLLATKLSSKA